MNPYALIELHPEKKEIRVYDYVDLKIPMLSAMYRKRLKGYKGLGFVVN